MNTISIREYAIKLANQLGLRVGIFLSFIVTGVLATILIFQYQSILNRAAESNLKNFSFWLQVNDQFQIQRSLANIVEAEGLSGALILDRSGQIVAQKVTSDLLPYLLDSSSWNLTQTGILIKNHIPLYEIAGSSEVEGKIIPAKIVPYYYVLVALIIFAIVTFSSVSIARSSYLQIATKFTEPVERLAQTVEQANSLADLDIAESEYSTLKEVEVLKQKMKDTGQRLLEQEIKVQEAEKQRELLNLGRQVAHDIRSPVSALKLAIQATNAPEAERKSLIVNATARIEKIASDLLQSTRDNPTKENHFSLRSVCEKVVREKQSELRDKAIDLKIVGAIERPSDYVNGDESVFQRILSNLLNNAAEAVSLNGKIELTISGGNLAHISIADNGSGIASELLSALNRGVPTTSKPNGNGLGTSHAYRVISDWGGSIAYSSQPSEGTRVEIQLPWSQRQLG